jgi:RNA polymerase sigma factor (sigma-70 family)
MSITIDLRPGAHQIDNAKVGRLIGIAAAGDEMSWQQLVQCFHGMLHSIARSYRLCDADIADVVQTTWLKLVEHLDGLHDPERVGPWLATTVRRECLAVLGRAGRQIAYGDDCPECEGTEPRPGEEMLQAERDRMLWSGVARLRGTDQALLRLLVADERPGYDEISSSLGMPVGSIGPTRARALARLRRELARDGSLSLLAA